VTRYRKLQGVFGLPESHPDVGLNLPKAQRLGSIFRVLSCFRGFFGVHTHERRIRYGVRDATCLIFGATSSSVDGPREQNHSRDPAMTVISPIDAVARWW